MTATLLLLMMVTSAGGAAPLEGRYPAAVEVFRCDFGSTWDANYDAWPEGWSRKRGPRFPLFLAAKIHEDKTSTGGQCLTFRLDGGGVAALGPPITVGPLFSYVLEAQLKTEGLVHDRAFLTVTFYDAQRKPLETFVSDRIRQAEHWTKVRIGPIASKHESASYANIGLHLEPTAGEDLTGSASFADIWLARVSRMMVTADSPSNLYQANVQPKVTCQISGVEDRQPEVTFELLDVSRKLLLRENQKLTGAMRRVSLGGHATHDSHIGTENRAIRTHAERLSSLRLQAVTSSDATATELVRTKTNKPLEERSTHSTDGPQHTDVFVGETSWTPAIPDVGFYWVRVTMQGSTGVVHQHEIPLTIFRPEPQSASGEFGWTLPEGEGALSLASLADTASLAGIHGLKLPLWFGPKEMNRLDRLVSFAERLQADGIELIGLLDHPPAEVIETFGKGETISPARVFAAEPDVWYPSLEPILTRLSLNVRCWQLGGDHDQSFVGYPAAAARLGEVKKQMERYGQKVQLGVGWNWLLPLEADADAPWSFISLTANPALTAGELAAYLRALPKGKLSNWIVLDSLPASEYSTEDRAKDMMFRMLQAKIHGADRIFFSNPLNTQTGLLNDEGKASEMFLPWRTAAHALAAAEHLGSVPLPEGSSNHLFARGGKAVMVVWNENSTTETIYLGEGVEQLDPWGRRVNAESSSGMTLKVSPVPTFVFGVDEALMRFHMACDLNVKKVPSVFGTAHPNALKVQNTFGQGISGRATLMTPDVWRTSPREINFRLAAGETKDLPFQITLPFDASSGPQTIRLDFEISAERRYQFSIYRSLDIGLGEVSIDLTSRINPKGELEITQQFRNQTDEPVSFRCQLLVPGRQRMLSQVVNQSRGVDTYVYRFERGGELIGKTLWLRAEEIGGSRSLNYRFTAQE